MLKLKTIDNYNNVDGFLTKSSLPDSFMSEETRADMEVKHTFYKNNLSNLIKTNEQHVVNTKTAAPIDGIRITEHHKVRLLDEIKKMSATVDRLNNLLLR